MSVPIPSRQRLTYEDYAALPDDGIRRQLIDGELIVTPSPNVRHQELVKHIVLKIEQHLQSFGGGRVFIAPLDVLLSPHDVVQPDVLFVAEDRLAVISDPNIKGAPSLAIEVVSDERLDLVEKRNLYEKAGIPVYWAVEPKADRVSVYRLSDRRYGNPMIVGAGDMLTIDALPGFSLDVGDLFNR